MIVNNFNSKETFLKIKMIDRDKNTVSVGSPNPSIFIDSSILPSWGRPFSIVNHIKQEELLNGS